MQGRSVRLFLVDGTPTGILTAEIMNWTGHMLVAPRSRLPEALLRDEAGRTGIYFLIGDDPDEPLKLRVYIGEGDSVADRLKSHAKDSSKDFWTRACVVSSKDTNLTKAHVRFLESRLVELAKQAGRSNIANGNAPGPKALPESDIADMEYFISQVQIILPVVGFEVLRPKAQQLPQSAANYAEAAPSTAQLSLSLSSPKHGYKATAVEVDGEITVLSGSTATTSSDFASNGYAPLRQELMRTGRLAPSNDPQLLVFTEAVPFQSASAAAAVITNRNTNGRTAWRIAGTNQTLKDWQDAQLAAAAGA